LEPMSSSPPAAITVRRPRISFDGVPRHWGRDPFETHFLNALSSTFPDGEAFFVRSVLAYREQIDAPELREAIRAFAAQEGQHSRLHAEHLQMLIDQGYTGLAARNRLTRWMMDVSVRRAPRASLAGTAALEHLTAMLARKILNDPEGFTGRMHPAMAALWQWHALEEAEHKSVAFDVLERVAPSHPLRVWMLASNTLGLFLEILDRAFYMLWKDGLLFRRETWAQGWRFLFGTHGFLRGLGPDYWRWYRRGFHPNDVDDSPMLDRFRPLIDAETVSRASG